MDSLRRPAVRVLLLLLAILGGLLAYASAHRITPQSPRLFDPFGFKAAEVERLRNALRDPESARFSDAFVAGAKPRYFVCGSVNQKGEAGGFVGRRRFIVAPTFKATEPEVDGDVMDELWAALCAQRRA